MDSSNSTTDPTRLVNRSEKACRVANLTPTAAPGGGSFHGLGAVSVGERLTLNHLRHTPRNAASLCWWRSRPAERSNMWLPGYALGSATYLTGVSP